MFSVSDLRNKGIIISGLRGSGKTTLAKFIAKHFKPVCFVENKEEWKPEDVVLIDWEDFSIEELEFWLSYIENWVKEGKVDMLIIDGFDLLYGHHLEKVEKAFRKFWISMRHMGLSVLLITRRPQDIPSRIWHSSDYLFIFHFEIPSFIKLLNNIEVGLGDKVRSLGKYEFVVKDMSGQKQTMVFKL